MGEIIFDFAKRRQQMEAESKRAQLQLSDAIQAERLRLAYDRGYDHGRETEQEEWRRKRTSWVLLCILLLMAASFCAALAFAGP